MSRVSVIVPAYNEEKKIAGVLKTLVKSGDICEVICVDDGSTDRTRSIAGKIKGVTVVESDDNRGKAHAIATGIRHAKGEIILFVDADLRGLRSDSLKYFIKPLLSGRYDVSIAYLNTNLDKTLFFLPLSGLRAYFKKDLVPYLPYIEHKGYGLELYLNYVFKDKRVKVFPLNGVKHDFFKHQKQKPLVATKLFFIECGDLASEIFRQDNPFSYFAYAYLTPIYRNTLGKSQTF